LGVGASAAEEEGGGGRGKGEHGGCDAAEGGELVKGKQRELVVKEAVKEKVTKDTRKWITVGPNGKPIPEEEEVVFVFMCVCVCVCVSYVCV
jgi:hypothetical protein